LGNSHYCKGVKEQHKAIPIVQ